MNRTPDAKLKWLLSTSGLHDLAAHHEIYRALRLLYPQASDEMRQEVVQAVQAYRWPRKDDEDAEAHTGRIHFDWLHWLHESYPACAIAAEALTEIKKRYPSYKPKDHPDFTHYTGSGWVGPQSPLSVEQLLAIPAAQRLDELLAYKGEGFLGPDRGGLLQSIGDAAKQDLAWSFGLAYLLEGRALWDSDLWPPLIRAWFAVERSEQELESIFQWLRKAELKKVQADEIADALYTLVRDGGKPNAAQVLDDANNLGRELWTYISRDKEEGEPNDWLQLAINRPGGVLAEFWVNSLSMYRNATQQGWNGLPEEYRRALTEIVGDQTVAGAFGRTVIASQLSFFLSLDIAWTRAHVLPLFDMSLGTAARQAWDGFLVWGRLTPAVAEAMDSFFHDAVTHLNGVLKGRSQRFIEFFTALMVFYVADPVKRSIPLLFKDGGIEARRIFASQIEQILRGMNEAQQEELWNRWLKSYWENRLAGVPEPLDQEEVAEMIDWVLMLSAVFPKAVALAERMPSGPLQHSLLVYRLKDDSVIEKNPDSVARLLLYLGKSESPSYIWHGLTEVIAKLNRSTLSEPYRQRIAELATRLGVGV